MHQERSTIIIALLSETNTTVTINGLFMLRSLHYLADRKGPQPFQVDMDALLWPGYATLPKSGVYSQEILRFRGHGQYI